MTQFMPMRSTRPPSTASRPDAGGRLCHSQKFGLRAQGVSTKVGGAGPVAGQNVVPVTGLAGLPEHSAVIRSVKSP